MQVTAVKDVKTALLVVEFNYSLKNFTWADQRAKMCFIYYIKLKSRLSVCTFWHADNSAVSAQIEMELARNESCAFEDHKVCF